MMTVHLKMMLFHFSRAHFFKWSAQCSIRVCRAWQHLFLSVSLRSFRIWQHFFSIFFFWRKEKSFYMPLRTLHRIHMLYVFSVHSHSLTRCTSSSSYVSVSLSLFCTFLIVHEFFFLSFPFISFRRFFCALLNQ